jgi:hypothetical protein
MFLAAESVGVKSCWINAVKFISESPEGAFFLKTLGIPEGHLIYGSGAFGYSSEKSPEALPRKQGTVHFLR